MNVFLSPETNEYTGMLQRPSVVFVVVEMTGKIKGKKRICEKQKPPTKMPHALPSFIWNYWYVLVFFFLGKVCHSVLIEQVCWQAPSSRCVKASASCTLGWGCLSSLASSVSSVFSLAKVPSCICQPQWKARDTTESGSRFNRFHAIFTALRGVCPPLGEERLSHTWGFSSSCPVLRTEGNEAAVLFPSISHLSPAWCLFCTTAAVRSDEVGALCSVWKSRGSLYKKTLFSRTEKSELETCGSDWTCTDTGTWSDTQAVLRRQFKDVHGVAVKHNSVYFKHAWRASVNQSIQQLLEYKCQFVKFT